MKKRVLIMASYYIPSVKGGGPIRSIKNIVDNLSDEFDFYIVAADRDLGDRKSFENVEADKWVNDGKANVYYTDISSLNWKKTKMIIDSSCCKIIYFNSFFNYKFTILPLLLYKLKKIDASKIIIAPRGQFSPGALRLKRYKKRLFIILSKIIGLYGNVLWHATSDLEKEHIQKIFGDKIHVAVANNLTSNYNGLSYDKCIKKHKGELKVAFVSRIHPKKNLKFAIQLLSKIKGTVIFNIYGPIEDVKYWEDCKREITLLPPNVKVVYQGVVSHEEVIAVFKNHHVFLFPTLGENYGHVISEAFIGGCPVIVSDQTPWRGLEALHVGWDISLKDKQKYTSVLEGLIDMRKEEYENMSMNAFNYGLKSSKSDGIIDLYRRIFGE